MNVTQEFKDERVAALRKMADWLEAAPLDLPIPHQLFGQVYSGRMEGPNGIKYDLDSTVGMALIANAAGNVDKEVNGSHFKLVRDFGGGIKIEWVAYRETVCEKVVIGKKVIPAEPERVVAATPEREEDVVEWKCPSLLKASQSIEMPEGLELEASAQPQLPASTEDDIPW